LDVQYRDVRTSRDKPAREVTVRVRFTFIGPLGDRLSVVTPGESMDDSDKGTAKAMSVAMRTALLQTFALPTDDPDPDASDVQRGDRAAAGRPATEPREQAPGQPSERALNLAAAQLASRLLSADADGVRAMWKEVFDSPAAQVDVSGLLTEEQRAGLDVDARQPVTLLALRNLVASSLAGKRPAAPADDPAPATDPGEIM
ncbi:MAG TPA: ERF family protein, partial [Naasia sp.]